MTAPTTRDRPPVLLRVVLADCGISSNESLTSLLAEFEGISVLSCAQEPAKVIALVEAVQPEVVILDLQTEQATGLRTLRQIKELPHAPVVIVLSLYDLPSLRRAVLAAGGEQFLVKPTDCDRLEGLLEDVIQRHAATHPATAASMPAGLRA